MLKECLDVFKKIYEEKGESLILDTYVPAEGSYVLVDRNGEVIKEIKISAEAERTAGGF